MIFNFVITGQNQSNLSGCSSNDLSRICYLVLHHYLTGVNGLIQQTDQTIIAHLKSHELDGDGYDELKVKPVEFWL